MDTDKDLKNLMAQATSAYKEDREINQERAIVLAQQTASEKFMGAISADRMNQIADLLAAEQRSLDLQSDLLAGMSELKGAIVDEMAAANRGIVAALMGSAGQLTAAARSALGEALDIQNSLKAQEIGLDSAIAAAVAANDQDALAALAAQKAKLQRDLDEARNALADELKNKFDEIGLNLDATIAKMKDLQKQLQSVKSDLADLANFLGPLIKGLTTLPGDIFDPKNIQYMYWCDACAGLLPGGCGSGCYTEQNEGDFYLHAIITPIVDGPAARDIITKKYTDWEINDGPCLSGAISDIADKSPPTLPLGRGFKMVYKGSDYRMRADVSERKRVLAEIVKEINAAGLSAIQNKLGAGTKSP